ncbi:amidohydrolase [Shinella sp.]|uniref:amidohydrolase n=1 Tax=Shinella sp. TaxID=1870904 RepID=UPI003D28EB84
MTLAEMIATSNAPAVTVRRDLHRHPETAFLEYRTASRVAAYLDHLGFAVRTGRDVMDPAVVIDPPSAEAVVAAKQAALATGGDPAWMDRMPEGLTGVVADYRFGDGPIVAFRFDMDALPVNETGAETHRPNAEDYRSRFAGRMHACGHDGHVGIGLALARRLCAEKGLSGTLRLIFQPAEESARGAAPMVAGGAVDAVDHLFVGHLGCLLPSGRIGASAVGFLFSSRFVVTFRGAVAHAAMGPQEGRNALLAGASAALGLHGISRFAGAETFVNVGVLRAGTAFNIVADTCEMLVEVRADDRAAHDYMVERLHAVIEGAAAMQQCGVDIVRKNHMPGNENSRNATDLIADVARGLPGVTEVLPEWSIGGGDDACLMIRHVRENGGSAAYCIIGSDIPAVHHAADFDIDEASLETGVALFAGIAQRLLGGEARA